MNRQTDTRKPEDPIRYFLEDKNGRPHIWRGNSSGGTWLRDGQKSTFAPCWFEATSRWTEIGERDLEYLSEPPTPGNWEFREPRNGDIAILYYEGRKDGTWKSQNAPGGTTSHLNRRRWCKKPEQIPWTREDVPPVCWIISPKLGRTNSNLVIRISSGGITTGTKILRTWQDLFDYSEYSTDLKTWKPCRKEG